MFVLSDFCMTIYLGAVKWKLQGSKTVVRWDTFIDPKNFERVTRAKYSDGTVGIIDIASL